MFQNSTGLAVLDMYSCESNLEMRAIHVTGSLSTVYSFQNFSGNIAILDSSLTGANIQIDEVFNILISDVNFSLLNYSQTASSAQVVYSNGVKGSFVMRNSRIDTDTTFYPVLQFDASFEYIELYNSTVVGVNDLL